MLIDAAISSKNLRANASSTEDWRKDWQQFIDKTSQTNDQRLDEVAETYSLTKPSELPRPGEVANWTLPEWRAFAAKLGMSELEKTKHSYMFRHDLLHRIRLAPASSTGDTRSVMNLMQDFRLNYKHEVGRLFTAMSFTFDEMADEDANGVDFLKRSFDNMNSPEFWKRQTSVTSRRQRLGLTAPIGNFIKILRILRTEFNLSFGQSLSQIGSTKEEYDQLVSSAQNADMLAAAGAEVSSEVITSLRDLLDILRSTDRIEKERRRAERDARNKPVEVKAPAASVPKTPQKLFNEGNAAVRAAIAAQADIAREALKRMEAVALQPFPGPDMAAIEKLTSERNAQEAAKFQAERELEEAQEKIASLQQTIVEIELTDPWEGRLRMLALSLHTLLADNDLTKLVFNLDEARKLIANAVMQTEPKATITENVSQPAALQSSAA